MKKEIKEARITNGNDKIQVEIKDDKIVRRTGITEDENEIYAGYIQLEIYPDIYAEIKNAQLVIEYEDRTEQKLFIGDFAFCEDQSIQNEECMAYMDIAVMRGVPCQNSYGGLAVNAIVVDCNAIEELELTRIDFGLSSIGIDADRIQSFTGEDIDSIDMHVQEQTLDQVIDDPYKKTIKKTDTECNVHLEKGRNYIFVPLTYESEITPQALQLFAVLIFSNIDHNITYTISSFQLYSIFTYKPGEIKSLFK
jgi:hypothetical protein